MFSGKAVMLSLFACSLALAQAPHGGARTGGGGVTLSRSGAAATAGQATLSTVTNLLLRSQELDNGAIWQPLNDGSAVATTGNTSDTTAPDLTSTATKIVFPAVATGGHYAIVRQPLAGLTNGGTYTLSGWCRGNGSGTSSIYFVFYDGSAFHRVACPTSSTTWTRFSVSGTMGQTTTNLDVGINTNDSGQTAQSAQTAYVRGMQFESGSTAHFYVPTTSAAASGSGVTVSTTALTSSSLPILTHNGTSTSNLGTPYAFNAIPGTSFDIRSSNASDADKVNWLLLN